MSPADLTSLRHLLARLWPDVARSHGVKLEDVNEVRACRYNGTDTISLIAIPLNPPSSARRALHTLADVLEDEGWIVRRDGDDIYVERRATAAELDRSTPEGYARLERILDEREARRQAWKAEMMDAAREHGARVASMTRGSRY